MVIKYMVLPKNSGNLNRAPAPVVVCPSSASCGYQYALWICVRTVVKLRGCVIKFSAFLWGYVLVIWWIFFTTDMTDFKEQRICIKFCFNLEKTTAECYRKPLDIMPWAKAKLFLWYKRFKDRRTSADDDGHSGRPLTSTTPENTAKVRKAILADRRQTIHDVCEIVGLSYRTVQCISADNLNMRRISARFVPRLLSDDQKALRVSVRREPNNKPETSPTSSPTPQPVMKHGLWPRD
jgi:hypothetical protein